MEIAKKKWDSLVARVDTLEKENRALKDGQELLKTMVLDMENRVYDTATEVDDDECEI